MASRKRALLAALPLIVLMGMGAGINSSARVGDGEEHNGDLKTLNGGITIGDNARVHGSCSAVNGGVVVGREAEVEDVNSVNGGVRVGERAIVHGDASSVNGQVTMDMGASTESVNVVNGTIKLTGAQVTRNVETVNGDISLREGTTVGGDVIVRETHGSHRGDREDWEPLKIMIEGGSVVRGNVIVEDSDRRVEVHLRDGGRVQGRVQNAKVIQD